jgi:hypothetical protein
MGSERIRLRDVAVGSCNSVADRFAARAALAFLVLISSAAAFAEGSLITSPVDGSTLASSQVELQWTQGGAVADRYLSVGATPGGSEYYSGYQGAALSRIVTGLPVDGRRVYVRLFSWVGGAWLADEATYTVAFTKSVIDSPAPGSTITTSSLQFHWSTGSASTRYLMVGTSPGGAQLHSSYGGANLSGTVSGIPLDGSAVHTRLLSWNTAQGAWEASDASYATSGGALFTRSVVTSPAAGTVLTGTSATFEWSAGSASARYLMVGTSPGGSDLYSGYQAGLSYTVPSGIPLGGHRVYVRLLSWNSAAAMWEASDHAYVTTTVINASCAASNAVTFEMPFMASGYIDFFLKPGETAAGRFTAYSDTAVLLSTSEISGWTYLDNQHQVSLSVCPGDFTQQPPCGYFAYYTGSALYAATGASGYSCGLVAGKTYYMNVRHKRYSDGADSCSDVVNGCGIRVTSRPQVSPL